MKKLNSTEMEALNGGQSLLPPGPGEAERCRAQAFAAYVRLVGNPGGLTPNDFYCAF